MAIYGNYLKENNNINFFSEAITFETLFYDCNVLTESINLEKSKEKVLECVKKLRDKIIEIKNKIKNFISAKLSKIIKNESNSSDSKYYIILKQYNSKLFISSTNFDDFSSENFEEYVSKQISGFPAEFSKCKTLDEVKSELQKKIESDEYSENTKYSGKDIKDILDNINKEYDCIIKQLENIKNKCNNDMVYFNNALKVINYNMSILQVLTNCAIKASSIIAKETKETHEDLLDDFNKIVKEKKYLRAKIIIKDILTAKDFNLYNKMIKILDKECPDIFDEFDDDKDYAGNKSSVSLDEFNKLAVELVQNFSKKRLNDFERICKNR